MVSQPNSLSKICILSLGIALAGCQKESPKAVDETVNVGEITSLEAFFKKKPANEDEALLVQGMKAVVEGDLKLASRNFNTLLIDSPFDAQLHTLNGLTYQLMAEKGEPAKYALAQAGFEQALKIDPHITTAMLQLGRIHKYKKDYVKAQECFSDLLIHDSGNIDAYYELASVSYQMGDLKTAAMGIDRAILADKNRPEFIRAGAMIYAALGNEEQAEIYAAQYSTMDVGSRHKKHLQRRVDDWLRLHKSGRLVAQADTTTGGGAAAPNPASSPEAAPSNAASGTASNSEPSNEFEPPVPASNAGSTSAPAPTPTVAAAPAAPAPEPIKQTIWEEKQEDMVVIDAVIMRVSDIGTTRKGTNIMESLQMSLVPGNFFKARGVQTGFNSTSNAVKVGDFTATGLQGIAPINGKTGTLITQGLSFGTIQYSLDIANARDQYAEIIGRPTLTATVGEAAKFMSGRNRKISVNGQFGGNVTSTPIGTTLDVKVREYKDGFITLEVEIIGSSFEQGDNLPSDQSNARDNGTEFTLNEDRVKTVVKVRAGESIMLGGITQRELKTSKDGVPVLQSIPLIQYFFSRETSESDRRSVMIILTPRSYKQTIRETKQYFARGTEFGRRPKLAEFERRFKDWYDPSINNTLILSHLSPVYDEFRTGDLHSIKWGHDENVNETIRSTANFIYY